MNAAGAGTSVGSHDEHATLCTRCVRGGELTPFCLAKRSKSLEIGDQVAELVFVSIDPIGGITEVFVR